MTRNFNVLPNHTRPRIARQGTTEAQIPCQPVYRPTKLRIPDYRLVPPHCYHLSGLIKSGLKPEPIIVESRQQGWTIAGFSFCGGALSKS
jgi:hypothetical protein